MQSLMNNKEKEVLKLYFGNPVRRDGFEMKSPYIAALIDSRITTCRNKRSGKKLNKGHGSWIGSLGYMALLDHVGKIIKPKNKTNKENNSFLNSLRNFSSLGEDEIYALYSLRCSFAHDYSLFNIPKEHDPKKELKYHRFRVTQGDSGKLIVFPKNKWSGDFKDEDNITIINLELFCDLVESIHKKIVDEINKDGLSLLVGIEDLLIIRYQI